jgi:hypothetical protein
MPFSRSLPQQVVVEPGVLAVGAHGDVVGPVGEVERHPDGLAAAA